MNYWRINYRLNDHNIPVNCLFNNPSHARFSDLAFAGSGKAMVHLRLGPRYHLLGYTAHQHQVLPLVALKFVCNSFRSSFLLLSIKKTFPIRWYYKTDTCHSREHQQESPRQFPLLLPCDRHCLRHVFMEQKRRAPFSCDSCRSRKVRVCWLYYLVVHSSYSLDLSVYQNFGRIMSILYQVLKRMRHQQS